MARPPLTGRLPVASLVILALTITLAACSRPGEQTDGSGTTESTGSPDEKETTHVEDPPSDIAEDLVRTEWVLVSLYGDAPLDSTKITLNVDEDGIGGSTGCNYYGGKVAMNEGVLKARDSTTSTLVGCKGGVGQQEEVYLRSLGDAASYRVQDGRLEIQDAAGETTLVFAEKKQRDVHPADLVGTAWRLYLVGGAPAPEELEATLYFSSEGRIRGYGGCSSYSGSYEAEGDDITVIGLAMEEMTACGPQNARTQMAGLDMGPYDYALSEDRLEFFAERGGVLVFVPLSEEEKSELEDRLSKEGEPRPEPPGLRPR